MAVAVSIILSLQFSLTISQKQNKVDKSERQVATIQAGRTSYLLEWRRHISLLNKGNSNKHHSWEISHTRQEPITIKDTFCTFFPQCPLVTQLKEFHNLHLRQLLKCSFGLKCQINPTGRINPLLGLVYQRHCPSIYLSLRSWMPPPSIQRWGAYSGG